MKLRTIKLTSLAFASVLLLWAWTTEENTFDFARLANRLNNSFTQFKNKAYFAEVFTDKERSKLLKQEDDMLKGDANIEKYKTYNIQINNYKKITASNVDDRTKKKAEKQIKKYEKRASKYGMKATSYYNDAQTARYAIYEAALKRLRNNNTSTDAQSALKLEAQASVLNSQANAQMKQSDTKSGLQKFDLQHKAFEARKKMLFTQEIAFGVYKNDPAVTKELISTLLGEETVQQKDTTNTNQQNNDTTQTKETKETNKVVVNVEQHDYDPLKDSNLYSPNYSTILAWLTPSDEEKKQLDDIQTKNKKVVRYNHEVDSLYLIVDSLNILQRQIENTTQREMITQRAVSEEQWAFARLLASVKTSLEANEQLFNFYNNHLNKLKAEKTGDAVAEATKLQTDAKTIFDEATKKTKSAQRMMYKSEQYIQFMEANSLQLVALQRQENAFGHLLDIPALKTTNVNSPQIAILLSPDAEENEVKEIKDTETTNETDTKKSEGKKEKTVVTSNYIYSIGKPKPRPVTYPKGVVFKVQVGYFKRMISPEKFPYMQPVNGQKFNTTPYQRFMVGEFSTFEAADKAKDIVQAKYKDAFVVAYLNGKRIANKKAKAIAETSPSYKNTVDKELLALLGKKATPNKETDKKEHTKTDTDPKTDGKYIGLDISKTTGTFYTVQLGSYSKEVTLDELKNLPAIYYQIQKNGHVRYLSGLYATRAEADKKRDEARKAGIKDAFVAAYHQGEHVSLATAKKLMATTTTKPESYKGTKPEISFMVQVGAFSVGMPKAMENKLKALPDGDKIHKKRNDSGLYLYMIGNYPTYKQAQKLLVSVKESGLKDSFIVAYKNDTRIEVSEAIKLLNN